MNRAIISILGIVFLLFLVVGCSGGHTILPETSNHDSMTADLTEFQEPGPGLMGLYNISIDPETLTGSVELIRSAAALDVLEAVDITGYLTSNPCKDCVKIFNIGFDADWNLVLGIGIKHPFDVGDPAKPITGRNRADLHVFNVEGIILTDDPEVMRFTSANNFAMATGNLLNPDGYTQYLDYMFDRIFRTTSDLHPYKLHFDNYSTGNFGPTNENGFADVLNPVGNLVMKMGSDYSIKDYVFNIQSGQPLNFVFAVGCTYGFAINHFLERFDPVFRMPQFNKKAASEVHLSSTVNNLKRGDTSSTATIRIEVMDINHDVPVGTELNEMLYKSDVDRLVIYAPGITDDIVIDNPPVVSGDGRNTPLVFEVQVTNAKNARSGMSPVLVKVRDSYPARQNPNPALVFSDIMGREDDGVTTELGIIIEMATYAFMEIEVEPCDPISIRSGATVDIGVDEQGYAYIGYSDKQVWRYDTEYCEGEHHVTVDFGTYVTELQRVEAAPNGNLMTISKASPS